MKCENAGVFNLRYRRALRFQNFTFDIIAFWI
jgi:hypothetical protein